MNPTLHNIIELLEIVRMYGKKAPAPRDYVQKTFHEKPVRQARLPNYERTEMLSNGLGLVTIGDNEISLTDSGAKTLEFYEAKNLDFYEFFIKDVLVNSEIGQEIHGALSKFHAESNGSSWYPKQEVHTIFKVQDILPILYETGLLEKKHETVEIAPKYVWLMLQEGRITQKQLEARLESQKKIGAIAEEISLAYERNRLAADGCVRESKRVDRISERFANAGYDIESFARDQNGTVRQIYIEVKGSSGTELDFYMSANELQKAQEHGERYWLYFVSGIDMKTGSFKKIIEIQNPSMTIFNSSEYLVESESYHITKRNS